MPRYTLEADYKGTTYRHVMHVARSPVGWPSTLDGVAVVDAVFDIFRLGDENPAWKYGAIRLINPQGTVIKTMEAKEEA